MYFLLVQRRFFYRLAVLILHLLFLTLAMWLRPRDDVQLLKDPKDIPRLILEILTMVSCVVVLVTYVQEVHFFGPYYALSNLVSTFYKS